MGLTIDLPPDLERRVRIEAERTEVAPERLVLGWVEAQLSPPPASGRPSRSAQELALLEQVSLGFSEAEWREYRELVAARRSETLTEAEHRRLCELIQVLEISNARRWAAVVELSRLRNQPFEQTALELGLVSPGYV
jgi:hypothetical protein